MGVHLSYLEKGITSKQDRIYYDALGDLNCPQEICENSLKLLSKWIEQSTGIKPYILIDEYDVPLQTAFHYGYYDEMVSFIRSLFSNGLKTNPCFEKAV